MLNNPESACCYLRSYNSHVNLVIYIKIQISKS
uniref:Uncharacterized protein n=1 Tax=Arundo donax TaxID=35708 RepID=A0A0A9FDG5_ARUDO